MRAIFAFAKAKNIDCQLRVAKLIIDQKSYVYSETKDLPHGLSIEAAKMVKVEDGLVFQSKLVPLSNLCPCKIKVGEKNYNSVDQGHQFQHAVTCKTEDIAVKIMETVDPGKIMAIAQSLPWWEK